MKRGTTGKMCWANPKMTKRYVRKERKEGKECEGGRESVSEIEPSAVAEFRSVAHVARHLIVAGREQVRSVECSAVQVSLGHHSSWQSLVESMPCSVLGSNKFSLLIYLSLYSGAARVLLICGCPAHHYRRRLRQAATSNPPSLSLPFSLCLPCARLSVWA